MFKEESNECSMSVFSSLLSALHDVTLLPSWITAHGVDQEVILTRQIPTITIPTTTPDQSLAFDNRGTPLLIAIELDSAAACSVLLAAGANVNYRHPAKHGNCPLLRAAEMGLTDCLTLLLAQPSVDMTALTHEYKLVLGQNIPQYEAGGRSALLLAVEALQPEIVELILEDKEARALLLKTVDSFGRTPLQASFEVLALRTEGSVAHTLANQVCHLLCTATATDNINEHKYTVEEEAEEEEIKEMDHKSTCTSINETVAFEIAAKKHLTTKQMATDCLRERNRILRSRYLVASKKQALKDRDDGLLSWHANYYTASQYLHACVYNTSFATEDILLPPELLTPTTYPTSGEYSRSTSSLSPSCYSALCNVVSEPVPGTFTFPFLSEACCATLYAELVHYESTARNHPDLQLPLHIRHDGNLGQLEACGFEAVLKAIETLWQPLVARFMPERAGKCEVYHAFLTRNWVGRDANATFKTHCDNSDLTFNVCLQASEGFEGSTVGFFVPSSSPSFSSKVVEDSTGAGSTTVVGGTAAGGEGYEVKGRKRGDAVRSVGDSGAGDSGGGGGGDLTPEDPRDRVYTHTHRVGHAVMHDGAQWHRTDPITKGARASLIIWARAVCACE